MKRTISILAALLCIIGFRFLPAPSGMTSSAMQVLGIFIGALILWLTLSIDWPSLLALAALVTVPELTMGSVLANSLGNSTVAFLLFTFMCTYAISKTSFVKRCAILFISSRIARRSPWCFLILYCASILVIGLVMSPSVVFVIYLPILRTQHKAKQQKHGGEAEQADRYGKGHIMDIADAGAGGVLIKSNGHDGKHVGNGGHSA